MAFFECLHNLILNNYDGKYKINVVKNIKFSRYCQCYQYLIDN